jgi:hypothetical protein
MVPISFQIVFAIEFLFVCALAGFSFSVLHVWHCLLVTAGMISTFYAANRIYAVMFQAEIVPMQQAYLLPKPRSSKP